MVQTRATWPGTKKEDNPFFVQMGREYVFAHVKKKRVCTFNRAVLKCNLATPHCYESADGTQVVLIDSHGVNKKIDT